MPVHSWRCSISCCRPREFWWKWWRGEVRGWWGELWQDEVETVSSLRSLLCILQNCHNWHGFEDILLLLLQGQAVENTKRRKWQYRTWVRSKWQYRKLSEVITEATNTNFLSISLIHQESNTFQCDITNAQCDITKCHKCRFDSFPILFPPLTHLHLSDVVVAWQGWSEKQFLKRLKKDSGLPDRTETLQNWLGS